MVLGALLDDTGYKIVLVLHILTVIVGIGAVTLNGLYGAQVKARMGPEGKAIFEANLKVSAIAEYFVYAIPVFGIALVFMSDDVIEFDQTWIWLSILIYIVAMGISHGVMFPTARKMQALMTELNAMGPPPGAGGPGAGGPPPGAVGPPPGAGGPPPQVAQLEAMGKKLGVGGTTLNLLTVVLVVLMVWKPGL